MSKTFKIVAAIIAAVVAVAGGLFALLWFNSDIIE